MQIERLMYDLSVWRASGELKGRAEEVHARQSVMAAAVAEERKRKNYADFWCAWQCFTSLPFSP